MIDVEKFLISLRSNTHADGRLNPIHLADTVQEEIKIVEEAIKYSQRTWVELTDDEVFAVSNTMPYGDRFEFAVAIEAKLKEKNT